MGMERLTEPYGTDYFRICGNKTVYSCQPVKSSKVAFALVKLFQYENLGITPEEMKVIKEDYDLLNFNYGRVRKALKKQIPMKPLHGGNTDKLTGDIFICPSCSGVVGIDDMKAAYCADCGQKLDWEN